MLAFLAIILTPPHLHRRRAPPRLHPPCSRRCNCCTTASSYQPWRPWEKLSTTTLKPVQGTPYSRTRHNRRQLKPPSRPEGGAADGLVAAPQSPNPSRRAPTPPLQLHAGRSSTKLLPRLPSSPSRKPWAPAARGWWRRWRRREQRRRGCGGAGARGLVSSPWVLGQWGGGGRGGGRGGDEATKGGRIAAAAASTLLWRTRPGE